MMWQKCDLSEKLKLKKTLLYLVLILKTPVSEKSKKNFKPKSGLFKKIFLVCNLKKSCFRKLDFLASW
jgi:hypothetical protein